jgi:hypothetical protein
LLIAIAAVADNPLRGGNAGKFTYCFNVLEEVIVDSLASLGFPKQGARSLLLDQIDLDASRIAPVPKPWTFAGMRVSLVSVGNQQIFEYGAAQGVEAQVIGFTDIQEATEKAGVMPIQFG